MCVILTGLLATTSLSAGPFDLTYGGRLSHSDGSAVSGPVDLTVKFYRDRSGDNLIGVDPLKFSDVPLKDGTFEISLGELSLSELDKIFPGNEAAWIEIKDRTNAITYPRQKLGAVPYALKVPIDGNRLKYNGSGKLTLKPSGDSGQTVVDAINASTSQLDAGNLPGPGGDAAGSYGSMVVTGLQGNPIDSSNPSAGDELVWDDTNGKWTPDSSSVGTITDSDVSASAGIATSKISGPVTNIGSHGLGGLATLSSVSSTEVLDGTLKDVDLAPSAGIAPSKIGQGNAGDGSLLVWDSVSSKWKAEGSLGALRFGTTSSNNVHIQTGGQAQMTIDDLGRVGIGTSLPQNRLGVHGGVGIGTSYSMYETAPTDGLLVEGSVGIGTTSVPNTLEVNGTVGIGGSAGIRDTLGIGWNFADANIPSNSLAVQNKVGIGTTSPTSALDVTGDVGIGGTAAISGGLGVGTTFSQPSNISSMPANGLIVEGSVGIGTTSPAARLQVGTSGDGTVALANAWNVFSDERLKTDVVPLEKAKEMVDALSGYYYRWRKGEDGSRQIGVLAQEVERVLPELVDETKGGIKTVDYAKLSTVLIEAFKEAEKMRKAQFEELKAENEKLRADFETMKTILCDLKPNSTICPPN